MKRKKEKSCPYCQENKKLGNKFCMECGKKVNRKFDGSQYNYYCERCSSNDCVEHGDIFNRNIYCPKCGKLTKTLLTPM